MKDIKSEQAAPFTRSIIGLAIMLTLGACGPLIELPNSGPAPDIYNLTAHSSAVVAGTDLMLLVEDPTARGGLDVTLIARRSAPTELQYFKRARWAERTPAMLQAVIAESFEASGQRVTRARGGAVVPSRFELQVDIRNFQAEYFGGSDVPRVHVSLALNFVRLGPLEMIDTVVIDRAVYASGTDMRSVIAAFDEATQGAIADMIKWTIGNIKAATE